MNAETKNEGKNVLQEWELNKIRLNTIRLNTIPYNNNNVQQINVLLRRLLKLTFQVLPFVLCHRRYIIKPSETSRSARSSWCTWRTAYSQRDRWHPIWKVRWMRLISAVFKRTPNMRWDTALCRRHLLKCSPPNFHLSRRLYSGTTILFEYTFVLARHAIFCDYNLSWTATRR